MKKHSIRLLFVMTIFFAFLQINSYAVNSANSHWAYENYLIAKEDSWFVGEDGGGYAPDKPATREKAIAMLVQAWDEAVINKKTTSFLKASAKDSLSKFTDVSKISPAYKETLAIAVTNGIIQGSANKLNPKSNITRAEFAVILSKIIKTTSSTNKSVFKDKLPAWANSAILKAYSAGLISGYADKTFKPQKTITNAEAITMIKRWAYGENIYSVLNDTQLKRLDSYPQNTQGKYYLSNRDYRKNYKEEFHRLAKSAKEYVTTLGTYSYKDLQDTQKRKVFKDFYMKYCISPSQSEQIIDTYIDDIIKNKRIKSTRFLLSSSMIYKDGAYNAASIRGIEEFTMLEGTPEDEGTITGKKYQRDIELILQETSNGTTLLFVNNLLKPVIVK